MAPVKKTQAPKKIKSTAQRDYNPHPVREGQDVFGKEKRYPDKRPTDPEYESERHLDDNATLSVFQSKTKKRKGRPQRTTQYQRKTSKYDASEVVAPRVSETNRRWMVHMRPLQPQRRPWAHYVVVDPRRRCERNCLQWCGKRVRELKETIEEPEGWGGKGPRIWRLLRAEKQVRDEIQSHSNYCFDWDYWFDRARQTIESAQHVNPLTRKPDATEKDWWYPDWEDYGTGKAIDTWGYVKPHSPSNDTLRQNMLRSEEAAQLVHPRPVLAWTYREELRYSLELTARARSSTPASLTEKMSQVPLPLITKPRTPIYGYHIPLHTPTSQQPQLQQQEEGPPMNGPTNGLTMGEEIDVAYGDMYVDDEAETPTLHLPTPPPNALGLDLGSEIEEHFRQELSRALPEIIPDPVASTSSAIPPPPCDTTMWGPEDWRVWNEVMGATPDPINRELVDDGFVASPWGDDYWDLTGIVDMDHVAAMSVEQLEDGMNPQRQLYLEWMRQEMEMRDISEALGIERHPQSYNTPPDWR